MNLLSPQLIAPPSRRTLFKYGLTAFLTAAGLLAPYEFRRRTAEANPANIGKWNAPSSVVTVLSTELNSLANNTLSAQSAAIANQTNLDIYVDIELVLASLSPAAGAYVSVYINPAIDGTNYPAPTGADQRLQTNSLLAVFALSTTATTAQRLVIRNVVIPPATFKITADNQAGVALNASGNTLKFLPYDVNLNG